MNVTWGLDPKAQRISVYYTESSTIYEGMPVCYEFDATTNWLGVDGSKVDFTTTASTASLESTTTAEGYQNEGKFIRVEDPDADNIHAFAGVVAGGDHVGQAGPRAIDIYVPNGAIVPVRAGVECTVGRTILAVITATQYLGHPLSATQAKPVAVAWETNATLDTTAGIVLAKLDPNMFMQQEITGDAMLFGTGGTAASASQVVNKLNLSTGHTGGYATAIQSLLNATGTIAATGGATGITSQLTISGSLTATTTYGRAMLATLVLSGTVNSAGSQLHAVHAQLSGTPTFTACQRTSALWADCAYGVNPTAGTYNAITITNNGANQTQVDNAIEIWGNYGINNLFSFQSCDGITANFVSNGGTGGATTGLTSGGDWKKIKIDIGGTTYYMIAMLNPSEVVFA